MNFTLFLRIATITGAFLSLPLRTEMRPRGSERGNCDTRKEKAREEKERGMRKKRPFPFHGGRERRQSRGENNGEGVMQ